MILFFSRAINIQTYCFGQILNVQVSLDLKPSSVWSVHYHLWPWSVLTACTRRGAFAHVLFALCATEETSVWWTHSAIPEPRAHVHLNLWCFQTCWARLRTARIIHRPERGGRYWKLSAIFCYSHFHKSVGHIICHQLVSWSSEPTDKSCVIALFNISMSLITIPLGSALSFDQICQMVWLGFCSLLQPYIFHLTNHYYKHASSLYTFTYLMKEAVGLPGLMGPCTAAQYSMWWCKSTT